MSCNLAYKIETREIIAAAIVNDQPYSSEDDIATRVGVVQRLALTLVCSPAERTKTASTLTGSFTLRCYQDVQNGAELLDRDSSIVVCGARAQSFELRSLSPVSLTKKVNLPRHLQIAAVSLLGGNI